MLLSQGSRLEAKGPLVPLSLCSCDANPAWYCEPPLEILEFSIPLEMLAD